MNDPKPLSGMLRDYGDSGLRKIVRQAQRLLALEPLLDQCLPSNLRPYCHIAQITATELTLVVEGAAWMTHLRYLKPQLLQQLKKHPQCAYLKDIQFKIQPPQALPQEPKPDPIPRNLSAENQELLLSAADSITDPLLKKALKNLAKNK